MCNDINVKESCPLHGHYYEGPFDPKMQCPVCKREELVEETLRKSRTSITDEAAIIFAKRIKYAKESAEAAKVHLKQDFHDAAMCALLSLEDTLNGGRDDD